ncbi:hypothetical protein N7457_000386 [Penicillium paradoxum]|uniref:uncharacterized protein n=1 Tax=Penicillium paradoxum TaxID=176176 RepID=UPI0025477B56|nr:uncharacterized protein N7457_000386 [Penicillium paradoxum]KAJ5793787.1 hypothetical protein N7457_000386 [Penicillium paradoxum]
MDSPNTDHGLSDAIEALEISPISYPDQDRYPLRLTKSIRYSYYLLPITERGTVSAPVLGPSLGIFRLLRDRSYSHEIVHEDFNSDTVFYEIVALKNELNHMFKRGLTLQQEIAFENHLFHSLASMVYGSNMIEKAGSDWDITFKLCLAVFQGEEIPDEIEEDTQDYKALKESLIRQNLPASNSAVLKSWREVVQHAKAAEFMMHELRTFRKDLSEEMILKIHGILTHKIDADSTPWEEYSGVYRSHEVSAGLHAFPDPALVPHKMKSMIHDLENDLQDVIREKTIDPFALVAKYTHIFVNIHPFIDGNGRMCRLILNSMLVRFGFFPVWIGVDHDDRSTYLEITANGSALEDLYEDAEEDDKPELHTELASYVLRRMKDSMVEMISAMTE